MRSTVDSVHLHIRGLAEIDEHCQSIPFPTTPETAYREISVITELSKKILSAQESTRYLKVFLKGASEATCLVLQNERELNKGGGKNKRNSKAT